MTDEPTITPGHAFELSGLPNPPQTLMVTDGNGGMLNALAMPDLIAALEELIECRTISIERDGDAWRNADDDESIIKARAAIAKARGTQ